MFIEDSNVIKAPNPFILPFYGPPLIALLTFHTSISLKWGKIETFDKNRDLKNTQIVKKHRKNCECCPVSQLIVR